MTIFVCVIVIIGCLAIGLFSTYLENKKNKKNNKVQIDNENMFSNNGLDKELKNKVLEQIKDFNLGDLGIVPKKDIIIEFDLEELNFKLDKKFTKDEAVKYIVESVNEWQNKILNNSNNLKNYFLLQMLTQVNYSGYFDCKDYLKSKKITEEEISDIVEKTLTDEVETHVEQIQEHGLTYNIDFNAEEFIKKNFKFFDYVKFMKSLKIKYFAISFNYVESHKEITKHMSFQLSDGTASLFCEAYDQFNENLEPQDWHNF